MERFDALVIGGGPAGSTAAILLAQAGWSVALVEQKAFPRRKVCGEYLSATNWPLLARLGIVNAFAELAGPPVEKTAIFAGRSQYVAPLPVPACGASWGRALSRELLDTLLIQQAAKLGIAVFQPARCLGLQPIGAGHIATVQTQELPAGSQLSARVVIAAHGSWEGGNLPTQHESPRAERGDWLAFKAHFCNTKLAAGLMPLISFQDGYGGMVHCDGGRASLSFCIRRWRLAGLPRAGGIPAGEAALAHIMKSCPLLGTVLDGAQMAGTWLSAGVIRPGIRARYTRGIYVVGNAAGEAHPVVAEGISMAMQAAWLLAERLQERRGDLDFGEGRAQIGRSYAAAWRRAFAPRIYAAAAIAQWASRPAVVRGLGPLLRAFPAMVTRGAQWSGKSRIVVPLPSNNPQWRLT